MSDEGLTQAPAVFSSKERAALVAKALSEAARRARFSTKKRRSMTAGNYRAKRGERLLRLLRIWTFVGIVAIPTIVSAIYLVFIASDQYTAEARFTVRGGMPSSMGSMGSLASAPGMLIVQDTQIILNYILSSAMIAALEKKVDLQRLYSRPDIDLLSRLKKNASAEKTLTYWKRHVSLKVQMPAGIVVFTIRAFSPQDAVTLSRAALDASEQVVNDINKAMLADAVSLASAERERAEANLSKTRSDLEKARNAEGILNADLATSALTGLMSEVKGQLVKLQEEYDAQRRFVSADAPQMKSMETKIEAAKQELAKLQDQMTGNGEDDDSGEKVLAGSMSRLDYAKLNNTIAEGIYAGSLAALEQAHLASELKLMYINTFIQPEAPDQSSAPWRGFDMILIVGGALAVWGAVLFGLKLAKGMI
jgi:capsular polysaccharide transport system permease protein